MNELPEGKAIPHVGLAWHDFVHGADRKRGFRAFEACTMMSLRKSLRRGSVWINHSLSFRERDQMLILPDEWARDREKYRAMLGLPATAVNDGCQATCWSGWSAGPDPKRR